jgi:hypothetical protein
LRAHNKKVKILLFIPQKVYQDIYHHLFPKKVYAESVAFIFATILETDCSVELQFKSWYAIQAHEYEYRGRAHVELKDEMRQKIIKKAFDLNASIVELHSHMCSRGACFSPSDLQGFEEFVPHVWWRLNKKPYAAIVFSKSDFDAVAWLYDPRRYRQLSAIMVDGQYLYPTGLTLTNLEGQYGFWAI